MSVSHPPKSHTKLTYEHYTQFSDDGMRHEIVDGIHKMIPAPIPYHQKLSGAISFLIVRSDYGPESGRSALCSDRSAVFRT